MVHEEWENSQHGKTSPPRLDKNPVKKCLHQSESFRSPMENSSTHFYKLRTKTKKSQFATATASKPSLIRRQRRLGINLTNYKHK